MNYQEIPFLIWAEEKRICDSIAKILGRKQNTYLKGPGTEEVLSFIESSEYFVCYIFHFRTESDKIEELVKTVVRKNPLVPVILFSFQEIPEFAYRKYIRCGVADILVYNKNDNYDLVREHILKSLNNKWRGFRYLERERKKIFQATIVTAHHEINQPLTVILNSVGLFNMELERRNLKAEQFEKFFKYIVKGTHRIQEILEQFKKIENPSLQDYTRGVPMISMAAAARDEVKEKQIVKEKQSENCVLIIENGNMAHERIRELVKKSGFHALTASSGNEAVRISKRMLHKIQAVILDVDVSAVETEELIFELKVHAFNVPILLISRKGNVDRINRLLNEGAHALIQENISEEQFKNLLENTYKSVVL